MDVYVVVTMPQMRMEIQIGKPVTATEKKLFFHVSLTKSQSELLKNTNNNFSPASRAMEGAKRPVPFMKICKHRSNTFSIVASRVWHTRDLLLLGDRSMFEILFTKVKLMVHFRRFWRRTRPSTSPGQGRVLSFCLHVRLYLKCFLRHGKKFRRHWIYLQCWGEW